MLYSDTCYYSLLSIITHYYPLLPIITHYYPLLPIITHYYPLLPITYVHHSSTSKLVNLVCGYHIRSSLICDPANLVWCDPANLQMVLLTPPYWTIISAAC